MKNVSLRQTIRMVMKEAKPPTWQDARLVMQEILAPTAQKVRLASILVIVICAPIVLVGPSWAAMIDCVIIGAMLATIWFLSTFIKLQASFDEMSAAFKAMSEINRQLINSRLNEIKSPPLEPTDATRLH